MRVLGVTPFRFGTSVNCLGWFLPLVSPNNIELQLFIECRFLKLENQGQLYNIICPILFRLLSLQSLFF